ncbi:MAG: type II toxin-antitoxin system VapC family toxin, partial [Chloroflexota bacterium]
MPVFYLDTSALLKRYRTEAGSQVVDQIFGAKQADETLTTSYYTVLEGMSVARRLLKGRVLHRPAYNALMARFLDDASNVFLIQSMSDDVIARAIDVAAKHALRPGDSVQLASALIIQETIPHERVVLFVSDRELYDAGIAAGIDAINPENANAVSLLG